MLLYNNSVLQYKWFSFVWDLSFADCMRVVLRDVTPWAVLGRPTVGLLYTVLSLTHTHTHTLSLSLSLSHTLLWRFGPYSGHGLLYRGFTITLRHTTFGRTPLDE